MPQQTVDRLRAKTAALKKALAEKGAKLDPIKLRAAKKKIRRAQRRRRGLEARAKRLAGPAEAPPAS